MEWLPFVGGLIAGFIGINVILLVFLIFPCGLFGKKALSSTLKCPYCGIEGLIDREFASVEGRLEEIRQVMEGIRKEKRLTDKFLWMGKDKEGYQHFLCPNCGVDIKKGPLSLWVLPCKVILGILVLGMAYWFISNYASFGLGFAIGFVFSFWKIGF